MDSAFAALHHDAVALAPAEILVKAAVIDQRVYTCTETEVDASPSGARRFTNLAMQVHQRW